MLSFLSLKTGLSTYLRHKFWTCKTNCTILEATRLDILPWSLFCIIPWDENLTGLVQYDNSWEVQDIRRREPRGPFKVNVTLPAAVIRSVLSLCMWKCDLQLRTVMPAIISNHYHEVKNPAEITSTLDNDMTYLLFIVYVLYCTWVCCKKVYLEWKRKFLANP